MEKQVMQALIIAAKNATPNFVIKNARIINVFTSEMIYGDVAILDDTIIGIGDYECENCYDAGGAYLAPGLIDAHVHIESSMTLPAAFASVLLPCGTTSIIADPHEIANVCGTDGIAAMLHISERIGLNVFFMLPSCVPATPFESSGAEIHAEDMLQFMGQNRVLGLGEVMDFASVINCDTVMLDKLHLFKNRPIDGHAPSLSGNELNAYCVAGPSTDHECSNYNEVIEKLRAGMFILLRMGSAAYGIEETLKQIVKNNIPTDRVMFCTDDKHIESIRMEGHIDHIVRRAVACGIQPVQAIKMASFNTACAYGLKGVGAIAPGYKADMVLFNDLQSFQIIDVFTNGTRYIPQEVISPPIPKTLLSRINIAPYNACSLRLKVNGKMPVIRLVPQQIVTQLVYYEVPADDGLFVPNKRFNKLVILERHHAKGTIGVGIIEGLGINGGAIASTVAHDSHNMVIVGDNDQDMLLAIRMLSDSGGGFVVTGSGQKLAQLPLPIAGLMSDAPLEDVLKGQRDVLCAARKLGVTDYDPMITLSFMALPVIPEVRLTDKGLFDVLNSQFILTN